MGMMPLPFGALPIEQVRLRGQRPAHLVLISQVGALPTESNPVVIADRPTAYRWDWIRGLQACFWTHPKVYMARHVIDASKARPSALFLWDAVNFKGYDLAVLPDPDSIDGPPSQWRWRVYADRWMRWQERAFCQGEAAWS